MYEEIYGYCKYSDWEGFNENLPLKSAYGIVAVKKELTNVIVATDEDIEILSKNSMLSYLAERQESPLPFLPIRSENERKLAYRMLNEYLASGESINSTTAFETLSKEWNTHHISLRDKIYPKMPYHFARYVKSWQKNQNKRDAEVASGSHILTNALARVSESTQAQPSAVFNAVPLNNDSAQISTSESDPTETEGGSSSSATDDPISNNPGLQMLCEVIENQPEEPERVPKRKTCRRPKGEGNCPIPEICGGKSNRSKCVLNPPEIRNQKRKSPSFTGERTCQVCNTKGCKGSRNQSRCPSKRSKNT